MIFLSFENSKFGVGVVNSHAFMYLTGHFLMYINIGTGAKIIA